MQLPPAGAAFAVQYPHKEICMQHKEKPESIPPNLPILPLRSAVAYPFVTIPVKVSVPRSVKLVEEAMQKDHLVGLLAVREQSIELPMPGQLYAIGTVAHIQRAFTLTDNTMQIIVQGVERFSVEEWLATEPYLRARTRLRPDNFESGLDFEALKRSLRDLAKDVVALTPDLPQEVAQILDTIEDGRYLVYFVSSILGIGITDKQKILEIDQLKEKYHALIVYLTREKEVVTLGKKIQSEVREEVDKAQREYFLRQQLKAIHKELGEKEEDLAAEYSQKLEKANLPEEARKEAHRELERMAGMSPQSAEYPMIKTYLDWILDLPWDTTSTDQLDLANARRVLDADHYDINEVKERILEFLAVRKIVKDRGKPGVVEPREMATILCFAGPPGVGKTSLGQSIARALGRKFTHMSLGGMRDEAEIRGHRRTYIGAMPGRIIQALKRVGTRNPVFMLDEVDKVGTDWRGDPSSALLEVLDPAQNNAFRDNYLDLDFDLSEVMFITTANQLDTIPPPLRDRMEIIELDGYAEFEKLSIAKQYLVPRQLKANGLRESEVTFEDEALRKIIQDYTREAGVRNLERQIGSVFRKCAIAIASGKTQHTAITPELVHEYLKREKFESERSEIIEIPGIATGLAVTNTGGEILFIEATRMKGKGELIITGQLGAVMRESAQIAHSYVRSKAGLLGINPDDFGSVDVHLHVPAGATPKDGPSAGVSMVLAIASLFSGRSVRSDLGMTGEVTLRGRVLPVGGIKMKVLAAHRAGLKTIILPKRNEQDLDELPDDVRKSINFVLIDRIDDALHAALRPLEETSSLAA
jgi:ATP-dependent Lon protease